MNRTLVSCLMLLLLATPAFAASGSSCREAAQKDSDKVCAAECKSCTGCNSCCRLRYWDATNFLQAGVGCGTFCQGIALAELNACKGHCTTDRC